ncbi:MAG: electron transfer flavoprotein subunit beta/FixA family protein [Clostridiales Family XIII bacterium]|jgi:electron transfer flavoprotein beta subunit|nr:electron transfer flavoprotein subunit beta/FixA family protein [Clostridiales Family XIII bacterium]
MKILVLAKRVLDTANTNLKMDPIRGTLIKEGVPSILNPDDANALEAALAIKDEDPETTITILTMGAPAAKYMIRECLAMGADEAYFLTDDAFGGADTYSTSATLAYAAKKIGDFDLILAGRQSIVGDTAQVGPQVAQRLGLPLVTYAQNIKIKDGKALVERQLEDGYEVIEAPLPCLITAVGELNTPRYMTAGGILAAYEKEIITWGCSEIEIDAGICGLVGSPTRVVRSFAPELKGSGEMLEGSPQAMAETLISKLHEKHVI